MPKRKLDLDLIDIATVQAMFPGNDDLLDSTHAAIAAMADLPFGAIDDMPIIQVFQRMLDCGAIYHNDGYGYCFTDALRRRIDANMMALGH